MNLDIVEEYWKRCKGKVKAQWGKFTDDQLDVTSGKRVELVGKIQEASPKEKCIAEEENLSRRVVLRGVLAVGCGLLLPSLFSGCDSKQGANPTSSAPANSPATNAGSAAPAASKKVSQASVQYQTHPKGGRIQVRSATAKGGLV